MSLPTRTWLLTNIVKDHQDELHKLKYVCAVIRPGLYNDEGVEDTVSDGFVEEMMQQTGKTREEVEKMLGHFNKGYDVIERIEE